MVEMAEAEGRDPITKLVKSATSLQIPKEVFKHLKKPSFFSIIPDNYEDRVVHFNACEQVEFYWDAEVGTDVPVWARKGDFTLTLPKEISAIVAWGQCILDDEMLQDEELKDEKPKDELQEEKVLKEVVLEGEVLKEAEATPVISPGFD